MGPQNETLLSRTFPDLCCAVGSSGHCLLVWVPEFTGSPTPRAASAPRHLFSSVILKTAERALPDNKEAEAERGHSRGDLWRSAPGP